MRTVGDLKMFGTFLCEGVEAGEPTVSLFDERNQQLIRVRAAAPA